MKTRVFAAMGVIILGIVCLGADCKDPEVPVTTCGQPFTEACGCFPVDCGQAFPPVPGTCCEQDYSCNTYRHICEYSGPDLPDPSTGEFTEGARAPGDAGPVTPPKKHWKNHPDHPMRVSHVADAG